MSTCFDLEVKDGVAHLRFNRPEKLNSMTLDFWRELPEAVNRLSDSGEARALVLSSTGRHFTAGMDLSVFTGDGLDGQAESAAGGADLGRARSRMRQNVLLFQESFNALERARMPVIAAVQGGCVGGGVDLVSACDFRHCTRDAFFCIQEINLGLTADVGTLQRLPKLVPEGVVRELAYTGRRMTAERALASGLVNQVHEDQTAMLGEVLNIAGEIAEKSPLAVWGSKEMLNYARDHSVRDSLEYIATWQAGMFFGGDMQESFRARNEKRRPTYENLPPRRSDI